MAAPQGRREGDEERRGGSAGHCDKECFVQVFVRPGSDGDEGVDACLIEVILLQVRLQIFTPLPQ